jgi:triacylglycerol lipase
MSHAIYRHFAVAALAGLATLATSTQWRCRPTGRKIAAIGRVSDFCRTGPHAIPCHGPYAGVKVARPKYRPDERNALTCSPRGASGARPVLIFVHGGGFVRGSKRAPGSPFYDNIMLWAVKNGMVGVNMTYRLAPAHPWPAGQEDIRDAIRWVGANIASHGGDPNRVYLMGHSAGASHVALCGAPGALCESHKAWHVGTIMSSGTMTT